MKVERTRQGWETLEAVAGNGLLDRRAFLKGGAVLAAAVTGYTLTESAAAEPLVNDPWSKVAGGISPAYEQRSRFETGTVRTQNNPKGDRRPQNLRTPHHLLNGTITPNSVHCVVAMGGVPDIDPDRHRLVIHGLVKRPLVFTLDALARYPMVSRVTFLECGGNSAPLFSNEPIQANVQALHGLVSCSEWTGVRLSTLLEETGIDPKAKWLIAGDRSQRRGQTCLRINFRAALQHSRWLSWRALPPLTGPVLASRSVPPNCQTGTDSSFAFRIRYSARPRQTVHETDGIRACPVLASFPETNRNGASSPFLKIKMQMNPARCD